jgi:hypothetical protein
MLAAAKLFNEHKGMVICVGMPEKCISNRKNTVNGVVNK